MSKGKFYKRVQTLLGKIHQVLQDTDYRVDAIHRISLNLRTARYLISHKAHRLQ